MPYLRITTRIELSDNADYSDAELLREYESTSTPDEYLYMRLDADSDGETLDLGLFNSITDIVVANEAGGGTLTVDYTDADSDAHSIEILTGKHIVVSDAAPASDITFTSESGATARVYIFGT